MTPRQAAIEALNTFRNQVDPVFEVVDHKGMAEFVDFAEAGDDEEETEGG